MEECLGALADLGSYLAGVVERFWISLRATLTADEELYRRTHRVEMQRRNRRSRERRERDRRARDPLLGHSSQDPDTGENISCEIDILSDSSSTSITYDDSMEPSPRDLDEVVSIQPHPVNVQQRIDIYQRPAREVPSLPPTPPEFVPAPRTFRRGGFPSSHLVPEPYRAFVRSIELIAGTHRSPPQESDVQEIQAPGTAPEISYNRIERGTLAIETGAVAIETVAVAVQTDAVAVQTGAIAVETGAVAVETGAVAVETGAVQEEGTEIRAEDVEKPTDAGKSAEDAKDDEGTDECVEGDEKGAEGNGKGAEEHEGDKEGADADEKGEKSIEEAQKASGEGNNGEQVAEEVVILIEGDDNTRY